MNFMFTVGSGFTTEAPPAGGPATDDFSGAFPGSDWSVNNGSFQITSGALATSAAAECGARNTTLSFAADQYSQATITAVSGTGNTIGVAVRVATDGSDNWLGIYTDSAGAFTFEMVDGTWNDLQEDLLEFSASDVIYVEFSGTTLTTKNGAATLYSASNANADTGNPGVTGFGNSTNSTMDDWEGGDL